MCEGIVETPIGPSGRSEVIYFSSDGRGVADCVGRPRSWRYWSSQFFSRRTAPRKSWPCNIIRSMLFVFSPQQKQCARLFFGLTVACNSPQYGHSKRKNPSICCPIGLCRPSRQTVSFIGKSLRMDRSNSLLIMATPSLKIGEIHLLLPVRLQQDSIDGVDVDSCSGGGADGFEH